METGEMTMKLDEDFNFICDVTPQELLRLSELLDNFTEWYDCLYTPFIGGAFDGDLTALYQFVSLLQERQITPREE